MGELFILPFLLTLTTGFHWDPCQINLLVSQLMLKLNQSAIEKVRHRNSCCFVTFRASCAPVSEEGSLLKEVNTQCLHWQGCFYPKASTAFRQKESSSESCCLCEREQWQNLWSVNCIIGTDIGEKWNNLTWRTQLQQMLIPQHLPWADFWWNQGSQDGWKGKELPSLMATLAIWLCFQNFFLTINTWVNKHTRVSDTLTILLSNHFLFICPFFLRLLQPKGLKDNFICSHIFLSCK